MRSDAAEDVSDAKCSHKKLYNEENSLGRWWGGWAVGRGGRKKTAHQRGGEQDVVAAQTAGPPRSIADGVGETRVLNARSPNELQLTAARHKVVALRTQNSARRTVRSARYTVHSTNHSPQ